jgi:CBS domain-containing protein
VKLAGVKPDSALTPDQRVFEQLFVDAGTGLRRVEDRYLESRNAPVESVMVSNEPTVSRETPLWAVADALLKSHLSHIAVVEDGKPVGVIARHDLLRTYANGDLISR